MAERDPFIQKLADFRGISYEEAEKQHREDVNVEKAESAVLTGEAEELAPGQPGMFRPSPVRAVLEQDAFVKVVKKAQEDLDEKVRGQFGALAKTARAGLLPRIPPLETLEGEALVEATEQTMLEPHTNAMHDLADALASGASRLLRVTPIEEKK